MKSFIEHLEHGEVNEALPPHLQKLFDKKGNIDPKKVSKVVHGGRKTPSGSKVTDVTPKGYGVKESIYKSPAHARLQKQMDKIRQTVKYKNDVRKLGGTPEKPGSQNVFVPTKKESVDTVSPQNEDLRKWFGKGKEGDWVRVDTKGEIKGDCAREPGEGKPKCMPRSKAHSMDKDDRAKAARRKRRQDPVADRKGKGGKPVMVATEDTLVEKNVPTNPALWSKYKAQAKAKFDVYPSAYANGWASKMYKKAGGGWKTVSEGKEHSWKSEGHYTKDGTEWTGPQHAHDGQVMTGKKHTADSQNLYHYKELSKAAQDKVEKMHEIGEATYQGKKVPLNKPMQGDVKKSKVYVDPDGDGIAKKVNFGDPNMTIKKSNPARRKSFRARHKCDQKKPKDSAGYWSCKAW
jgi:hypothetical protein